MSHDDQLTIMRANEIRHTLTEPCPICAAPRVLTVRRLVCDHCEWQFERGRQEGYAFHDFFGVS